LASCFKLAGLTLSLKALMSSLSALRVSPMSASISRALLLRLVSEDDEDEVDPDGLFSCVI